MGGLKESIFAFKYLNYILKTAVVPLANITKCSRAPGGNADTLGAFNIVFIYNCYPDLIRGWWNMLFIASFAVQDWVASSADDHTVYDWTPLALMAALKKIFPLFGLVHTKGVSELIPGQHLI